MKFGVCGGDQTAVCLCALLAQDGHQVRALALDGAKMPAGVLSVGCPEGCFRDADAVILPLPAATAAGLLYAPLCPREYKIANLVEKIPAHAVICAGGRDNLPEGCYIEDYSDSPAFRVGAAVAAAEGAIELIMGATGRTIAGQRVLIIGFEVLGQLLSARLKGLGGLVTVCARREGELAMAAALGCDAVPAKELSRAVTKAQIVLNTLPDPLISPDIIEKIPADAMFAELLSSGGVSGALLPSKAAPLSMAELSRNGIYAILQEWEL